jgi:hypothetical protein
MSAAETTERSVLEAVMAHYKAEGFDFFVRPSPALLPAFMKGYRPDAIAIRPDKKIAIEVTRPGGPGERAKGLQERFSGQDDWEFVVFYAPPGAGVERIKAASREAIAHGIQAAIELRDTGKPAAALVMAWSALEAIGRVLLPDRLARPQPPASLIEILASEGYITPSEAKKLRDAAVTENAVAHGQLGTDVKRRELDALIAVLHTLTALLPENAG